MTKKRSFTPEQRLSILQEAQREGRSVTLRKYNIAPSLFDRWKKKYLDNGIDGLHNSYNRVDPTGEIFDFIVTIISFNTVLKYMIWSKFHQLSEDHFAMIHNQVFGPSK
jgi:hypothetical protein